MEMGGRRWREGNGENEMERLRWGGREMEGWRDGARGKEMKEMEGRRWREEEGDEGMEMGRTGMKGRRCKEEKGNEEMERS